MAALRIRFSQSNECRGVFSYALKVEVVAAEGISPKIFVFHQSPAGIEGNTYAEFDHVASPVDLHEIPEDAASDIVPWYRTDRCTMWFRAIADMKMAKQLFVDDILGLQRSYDTLVEENNFINQSTLLFADGGVRADEGPAPVQTARKAKARKAKPKQEET